MINLEVETVSESEKGEISLTFRGHVNISQIKALRDQLGESTDGVVGREFMMKLLISLAGQQ